jgi:putative transposase
MAVQRPSSINCALRGDSRAPQGPPADDPPPFTGDRRWRCDRSAGDSRWPLRSPGRAPLPQCVKLETMTGRAIRPITGQRRTLRLPEHNYAGHATYFVTICTYDRAPLFGRVCDGVMIFSPTGQIVGEEWQRSATLRPEIVLDDWVLMPNHLHALVQFTGSDGVPPAPSPRPRRSLGAMLAGFKSAATARIRVELGAPEAVVWQRNYYEHIVRGTAVLDRIRRYIAENPARWHLDRENDARTGDDPFDSWLDRRL